MYSTCLFCHGALGRNEEIEHFGVGRRLAFDAATGRLWVVCPRCTRWNLTPLEERWEAIEDAERAFRATRLRMSTSQIGLARLPGGTELVRIGRPLRPELAAWRYGDQFERRRRRARWLAAGSGAAVAATLGLAAAGPLVGVAAGALLPALAVPAQLLMAAQRSGLLGRFVLHDDAGCPFEVDARLAQEARLAAADDGSPVLVVHAFDGRTPRAAQLERDVRLTGTRAIETAGRLLPRINAAGARAGRVSDGVRLIEEAGDPGRFWRYAAAHVRQWGAEQSWGDTGSLRYLPEPVRLALEMAAHEESERRALEGELALLEQAWREAEAIAAVADDLLLAPAVTERLVRIRRDASGGNGGGP